MKALALCLLLSSQETVLKSEAAEVANIYRRRHLECRIDNEVCEASLRRALFAVQPTPPPKQSWESYAVVGLSGLVVGILVGGAIILQTK